MSACGWALFVVLLCARTTEPRHRDHPQERPREEGAVGPGISSVTREEPRPGLRVPGSRRAAPAGAAVEPGHLAVLPGDGGSDSGLNPGHRGRISRGTKGSWRRRVHVTSEPDRYFTTPRTEPPVPGGPGAGGSGGSVLLPLSGASPWAWAVLLLALLLFSAGLGGNLSLLCLVWNSLQLQSAWNLVLAGLALWDFLVLFFCLPVLLLHLLTGTRFMAALSCCLVPFLEVSSMGVATFSLCALSVDRFHSATSPAPAGAVEPCASILPKLSVVFVGALLLATPELLLYRHATLPPQAGGGHYSAQVDVCLAEPSPELPLAVLSLVLTYQEARSWWVFGCYLCLPLLFTLSCDLVTRRVTSQPAPHAIGRAEGGSRSSSPCVAKKEVASNRSPSPSVSRQEVCSRTSSLNRKLSGRGAGQRSVILSLIGLYAACTLPEAACSVGVAYLPSALPAGVASALSLVGQFLLFARCSATPLLVLCFSKPLGGAFAHCCCCCCDECHAPAAPDTPTASLATPSTLLATPLSAVAPPPQQQAALGTPC